MRRRGFVTRWGSSLATSALLATLLVLVGPSVVEVPTDPSAGTTYLCSGYSGCKKAGYGNAGYAKVSSKMFWRMYAGHNCTNYAAYRIIKNGGPAERPWSGGGNASEWGKKLPSITDKTPNVGAIAWWGRYSNGSGSAGHVAYVERVVSATEIIVSEDSWGGTFHWRKITKSSGRWPTGFLHFVDKVVKATAKPTLSGVPVVGGKLTATPGAWSIGGIAVAYQWYVGNVPVPGATASTFVPRAQDAGKAVSLRVIASRSGYTSGVQYAGPTAAVAEAAYAMTAPPVITGKPYVGEVLTATVGTWQPQPASAGYRWYVDGVKLAKTNKKKLALTQNMLGKTVSVVAVVRGDGFKESLSPVVSAGEVLQDTITVTKAFGVAGRPRYGETLQVTPGAFTPADAKVSYQWLRNGVPIPGAIGATYPLGSADAGAWVAPQVTISRPTYATVVQKPASPGRTSSPATIRMVTGDRRGRVYVRVRVTAPGVAPVPGKVWIRVGSWRDTVRLDGGKTKVLVPAKGTGKRTVVVRYLGSAVVPSAKKTGSVRIR